MISFNSLTKAQYDALSAITPDRIYFLTDTGKLKLNGVDYGAGGAGGGNPAYVELEDKTASAPATFEVDFSGKQIQKYPFEDAASGSISFSLKNSGASGDGYAPTVEIQIPLSGEVSTITLPEGAQVVDMPASLPGELSQSRITDGVKMGITYHDLVFRNEKDRVGNWQTYISHGYSWKEYSEEPKEFDDFWIEAREDDSTISCDNFDAKYKLSSSFDKITWTPLTGSTIATGVSSGAKLYFIGDTTALGSSWNNIWRPYSDKKYAIGGKILSLYNEMIEPVTLTHDYDLYGFQQDKSLLEECSVDFEPVKNFGMMFNNCSGLSALLNSFSISNATDTGWMFGECYNLSGLPDSFSCPNTTNTSRMFFRCYSLSALPDGFSVPNTIYTEAMFGSCSNLSALPDGFSCPNTTNTDQMFNRCSSLSALPDGFSCPNTTSVYAMFGSCGSLTTIGNDVKIANGTDATATDSTWMDKSLITTIGANFEFFTNATFDGTWDPALGIRNVFPNATSVGSGWRVYNHYDGE